MECKHCNALLEEGNTVCPNCGKDNAEEVMTEETVTVEEPVAGETAEEVAAAEEAVSAEAASTEETLQPTEMKKGITLTPGKLALIIGSVVVLVAVLVAAIIYGMGGFPSAPADGDGDTAVTEPMGTIPPDGDPGNVTAKGSYTVSDEDIVAAKDTVVANIGEATLTNGQLQIFYWMQVQNFLSNYGSYASYYGLDISQPLDTQICTLTEDGYTWQQYFLEAALSNWYNYQALANESAANDLELSAEDQEYLDTLVDNMTTSAQSQNFADAEELLAYNVGNGSSMEDYLAYESLYMHSYLYFQQEYDNIQVTDEEMETYYSENEASFTESGITKDSKYVDARHILVFPQGGTTDEETGETTYSEEAWETCRQQAQAILDAWLAGDATEESFAALANEKSEDPGSNTNGGLYEDIYEGQMVEPFEEWCFDESRQYGDTGLVQTSYGYHVMYYVGSELVWKSYAESDLIAEKSNNIVIEASMKYPIEIDYSAISLGYVDMNQWYAQ